MAGKTLPHCKDELYAENLHDECFFRNIAHFEISCGFRGASTCTVLPQIFTQITNFLCDLGKPFAKSAERTKKSML